MLATVAAGSKPQLGLDLQGGFSVVLQAKKIKGKLPPDESVEKAKGHLTPASGVDGLGSLSLTSRARASG